MRSKPLPQEISALEGTYPLLIHRRFADGGRDRKNAGGDIRQHHVYMCGPLPMVQAFEKKFMEVGVPAENIHFEEFNFR
jgi:ferredoxin-NADP reductase